MQFRITSIHWILVFLILSFFGPGIALGQLDRSLVDKAKNATALVERPSGDGFGSAFCISEEGFFITNEHVIEGETDKIPLILNSGTSNEIKLLSTIVRKDAKADLALLKVDAPPEDLSALELGNDEGLFETQQISVFGFPFGTALALRDQEYPSISINVGRITSLRKTRNVLRTIQIDAVVNPGNSGGPMLNDEGKVVGVIVEKVVGTDVNFSIPVTEVKNFLERPQVFLVDSKIRFGLRHQPTNLRFNVMSFGTEEPVYHMKLRLSNGVDRSQSLDLEPNSDGEFIVEIMPELEKEAPLRFPIVVGLEEGEIKGEMIEQEAELDDSLEYLAEIKSIIKTADDKWVVTLYDDREIKSRDLTLEFPNIWLGASKLDLNLGDVRSIKVGVPETRFPTRIVYEATLYADDRRVNTIEGQIPILGAPGTRGGTDVASSDTDPSGTRAPEGTPYVLPSDQPTFGDEELVYQFDKEFDSYAMAGADRYAVFKFGESQTVEIFDLLGGEIVHTIEDVDSDALICGGSDHLFITLPSQMLVQRYSLETFEREKVTRLSISNVPKQVHIGANADNYLFVFDGQEVHVFDVERLRPIPIGGDPILRTHSQGDRRIDVGAAGRTIGTIPRGYGPVHHQALFIGEDFLFQQQLTATSHAYRWARPTPHGRLFFMRGGTILNELGQDVSPKWLERSQLYPTVDPRYFISLSFVEKGNREWSTMVRVCTASDYRVVHSTDMPEELKPIGNTSARTYTLDRLYSGKTQVHFVPWAKLLFNVGYDSKTIYVRRYDFEEELRGTGEDFLFVDSLPPFAAFKNEVLRYQIHCKTNADSVSYRLLEGPDGMRVDSTGSLTWRPARGMPVGIVPVIVEIKSDNGDENLHTFEIALLPETERRR